MSKRVTDLTSHETLRLRCYMSDLREAALAHAIKLNHDTETRLFIAAHEFGETLNELGLQRCYRDVLPAVNCYSHDEVFDPNP